MKNLLTFLSAFFVVASFAQHVSCGPDLGSRLGSSISQFVDNANFNGSTSNPAYAKASNVKFETALISFPDGNSINYLVRFNPYNNEIEIKSNEKVTYLSKNKDLTVKFDKSKKEFKSYSFLDNEGNLHSGFFTREANSNLFSKTDFVYVPAQKAKSSYGSDKPAKFKENTNYFYKNYNNQLVKIPSRKKFIADAFPELSNKEIKNFLKEKKINLTKVSSLLALTDYIKTLEDSKYSDLRLVKSE